MSKKQELIEEFKKTHRSICPVSINICNCIDPWYFYKDADDAIAYYKLIAEKPYEEEELWLRRQKYPAWIQMHQNYDMDPMTNKLVPFFEFDNLEVEIKVMREFLDNAISEIEKAKKEHHDSL